MQPKKNHEPHLRVTKDDLKWRYEKGFLTVRGYIYDYLLAGKRKGWKLRTSVIAFCEELGIGKSAFYKAIADMRSDAELEFRFEIVGDIEMWIGGARSSQENPSTIMENPSTIMENPSTIMENPSTIMESKSPKSKLILAPETSPDLLQIYYNSLSVAHLPPAQERERGKAKLEEVIQESIDTHLDNPNRQAETKATNLNSGEGNFSAAAAIAQNFRFKQGEGESVTVDVVGESIDPQSKINAQCLNPVTEIVMDEIISQIAESELLIYIESKAPDNVRSKRGWARACLASDREYWEKTLLDERDRRENNAQITGIPIDSKYGCQNPTAYQLYRNEPVSIAPKTVGNTRAMLHAKWSLLAFRQEAIDRAIILGFVVTDQGIFLPPNLDPEFPLSQWEAF